MAIVTRRQLLVGIPLLAALGAVAAEASAGATWVRLGGREVLDRGDHDTIPVTAKGEFSALQVRVHQHAVQFHDMKVYFANGRRQDVELKNVIAAGSESRVIDLAGDKRVIDRIEFWYDAQTVKRGKRARVEVFGRR